MKFTKLASHALERYCFVFFENFLAKKNFVKYFLGTILFVLLSQWANAQITLNFPVSRAVVQRNNANQANLNIAGRINIVADKIEARLVPRTEQVRLDTIVATTWQVVQNTPKGYFSGTISAKGGWYNLEVRAIKNNVLVGNVTTVERVGIGEVFVFVGHSNAQGGAYGLTGYSATDDRISCIAVGQEPSCNGMNPFQPAVSSDSLWCKYLQTGDAQFLPVLKFSQVTVASGISPFSSRPWFWGIMGDSLSKKLNVPIMLYGAAFGGTKSEHWYKAALGIPFDHGFIKSSISMPYINLKNVLQLYVPLTGIRSVLCLHGVNERNDIQSVIQNWMQGYIAQSRVDSKINNLAWMIALDSYLLDRNQFPPPFPLKFDPRNAQTAISTQAFNFIGPDLDQINDNGGGIESSDRPDGLHFGNSGLVKAANAWANSINSNNFLKISIPKSPQSFHVQSIATGNWQKTNTWDCNCFPQNYQSFTIKPTHIVTIDAIKVKPLSLTIQGRLDFKNLGSLSF
jgi:hypothetical protein